MNTRWTKAQSFLFVVTLSILCWVGIYHAFMAAWGAL
jgi:hypothetical protein